MILIINHHEYLRRTGGYTILARDTSCDINMRDKPFRTLYLLDDITTKIMNGLTRTDSTTGTAFYAEPLVNEMFPLLLASDRTNRTDPLTCSTADTGIVDRKCHSSVPLLNYSTTSLGLMSIRTVKRIGVHILRTVLEYCK